MIPTTVQLFNAALRLSDAERLELVEALILSLHPENEPPIDAAWREVIERRAAELRSGEVTSAQWEQVKQQARDRLRSSP